MQTSRLYRRIYTYIALSVALAVLLTFGVLQFYFSQNFEDRKVHFMEEQAGIVLYLLQHMEKAQSPEALQIRVDQLATDLQWEIRYLSPPISQTYQRLLQDSSTKHVQTNNKDITLVIGALKPSDPAQGVIEFRIPKPRLEGKPPHRFFFGGPHGPPPRAIPPNSTQQKKPLPPPPRGRMPLPPQFMTPLILVCILLFTLGLFLIPLVRYLMRPFRMLSEALHKVSTGDFRQLSKIDTEFQPLVEAFNHMTTEVQAMLKEKQRLIADVSHELRSPLARMRVGMELLSKEGKGKAKYIERAIYEIEELDHLINDLLDISALELNTAQAPLEQIDVIQWVSTTLDNHQLWFEQHDVRVHRYFDPQHKSIRIKGRKHLLDRVLNNLLSNLVKHAPSDSDADISIAFDGEQVSLKVRDRGPGVPTETMHKLTEPFYRVDTSRTRKTGGTGLGLAIVQKIMALHHGELSFATPPDGEEGLEVTLRFPRLATIAG